MGCSVSRENGCYPVTCCCCLEVDEACSWVAAVGLVWGGVATLVDFISANLPDQACRGCLDHALNAQLSLVAGCINAVQWFASLLLLIGAKLENRWLLLPWLTCGVVSLAMQVAWLALTLPHTPSVRAAASLLQLAWGAHFFIVVKTQYTRLALTFTLLEEVPLIVPPNTPVRRHKRRWRRLHPACQPPIRVLVGVAQRLQRALDHARKIKEYMSKNGEQYEQEEEDNEGEEEEEEIRITVGSYRGIDTTGDEGTCSRRRDGWKTHTEWKTDGDREDGVCDVIVHSPHRDVRLRVVEKRLDAGNDENKHDAKNHKDGEDRDDVDEDETKKEAANEREEEEDTAKDEYKDRKDADDDDEKKPNEELDKKRDPDEEGNAYGNEEGTSGGQCEAIRRGGEPVAVVWRASKPSTTD